MDSLAKTQVLVLDDWGLSVFTEDQRRNILEILEDRYGVRSTIITSQLPLEKWFEVIGEPWGCKLEPPKIPSAKLHGPRCPDEFSLLQVPGIDTRLPWKVRSPSLAL